MKILGTGLNGLVGSRIIELLTSFTFQNISRSEGVDITNASHVEKFISSSDADLILHLAAKTDVDGCEADKDLGQEGDAWKINVKGTENVAKACEKVGKKLIYISTDFVFDGEIPEGKFYSELDTPNPVNWYAKTKYEGEKLVLGLSTPWIIMRIAYPYRAEFVKTDFVRAIKNRLSEGKEIKGVTDHIFAPTFIDDIAHAMKALIEHDEQGIYHCVGNTLLSPYDAACEIADVFNLNSSLISETTREEFFKNRAPRPFRLALKNDKIERLNVRMKSFREGLEEIQKTQV